MSNKNAIPPEHGEKKPRMPAHTRLQLMLDLANGEYSIKQLGKKYDRHSTNIAQFSMRHREEINAIKAAKGDAMAALWIANKAKRVATYQGDVERLEKELGINADNPDEVTNKKDNPALVRARALLLRSVAEELGDLTMKQEHSGVVEYRILGVDVDKLK